MKEKMLRSIWLRVCMIVAVVTTAFAGTVWANEPITVELEGFPATSGQIDGNISYSTTGGTVSDLQYPDDPTVYKDNLIATTFTLTAANNAKINSVTFHWTTSPVTIAYSAPTNEPEPKSGTVNANLWSTDENPDVRYRLEYPQVTELNCDEIVFAKAQESQDVFSIDYISVTYTPGDLDDDITINAQPNDASKGTLEFNGNVIIAKPNPGYGVADDTDNAVNSYTITSGNVDVVRKGNYFAVVPPTNCAVTINFVAHAGGSSLDFEKPLNNYTDWIIQGFARTLLTTWPNAHTGKYLGKTEDNAQTTFIRTESKIRYPGIFSYYYCPMAAVSGSPVTWKVLVSHDNSKWDVVDGNELSYTTGWNDGQSPENVWKIYSVDLSSVTDVYVGLFYEGNGKAAGVDDIQLTTATATVKVSVSNSGLSTYCNNRALDFSKSSIKAYYATATGTTLTFHRIYKVPAGFPVLLQKTGGVTDEEVPALVGDAPEITGNVFVRGTGAAVTWLENDQKYILYHGEFLKANENPVATYRAYIQLPSGNQVKDFTINLDADDTGIETIGDAQPTANDAIYNLAGQRLKKMQKGINIVNGKKMIQR